MKRYYKFIGALVPVAILLLLCGCTTVKKPAPPITPVVVKQIPGEAQYVYGN